MSDKYFHAYPNKIRLSLMSYDDHSQINTYQWSCNQESNDWIFEGMILNDQIIAETSPQFVKPIYNYIISGGCARAGINDCSTPPGPEPPPPTPIEPEIKNIQFIPTSVTICNGDPVPTPAYTTNPALQEGDTVTDDTLQITGDIITFIHTPTVISADPDSYTYNVTIGIGTITRLNCISIDPQCPSVCIPNNSGLSTQEIGDMIRKNSSFEPDRLLNDNDSIKTRDSIKSMSYDITVL